MFLVWDRSSFLSAESAFRLLRTRHCSFPSLSQSWWLCPSPSSGRARCHLSRWTFWWGGLRFRLGKRLFFVLFGSFFGVCLLCPISAWSIRHVVSWWRLSRNDVAHETRIAEVFLFWKVIWIRGLRWHKRLVAGSLSRGKRLCPCTLVLWLASSIKCRAE